MARKKEPIPKAPDTDAMAEKKPVDGGTSKDSVDSISSSTINSNTKSADIQGDFEYQDDEKGRHFWYVVYPTETYVRTFHPECTYDGSSGWGTAPDDWKEQLKQTGLAFNVSPLHEFDVNPDGTPKKPHWHVIVSWGNSTTYRSAKNLCNLLNSPMPKLLRNVNGAYRYHTHMDNPEKYQYKEQSECFNGWERPLDSNEVTRIKREIYTMVFLENITEYAELLVVCSEHGQEYFDVACNNTVYCDRICSSYRHSPYKSLMRYYNTLPDGEIKDSIRERLERFEERIDEHESNDFESTY